MRLDPGSAIAWVFIALVDGLVLTALVVSLGGWRRAWPILLTSVLAGAAATAVLVRIRFRERPWLSLR